MVIYSEFYVKKYKFAKINAILVTLVCTPVESGLYLCTHSLTHTQTHSHITHTVTVTILLVLYIAIIKL